MPVEYKVFFSWTGSTTWTAKPFNGNEVEIPPLGMAVPSEDTLVMYSKSSDRLYANMKTFGGAAVFNEQTVVRYEYWRSEKYANSTYSLSKNAFAMRNVGLTEFIEGNHRIVICRGSIPRNKRSVIILRASAFLEVFPTTVPITDLVKHIREHSKPEKGEGPGDAIEAFITDGVVPFLNIFVG
jgi:hypothetical protein